MLERYKLRTAETFALLFVVVYASNKDATSACSRAKLAFESNGINLFEIPAGVISGMHV